MLICIDSSVFVKIKKDFIDFFGDLFIKESWFGRKSVLYRVSRMYKLDSVSTVASSYPSRSLLSWSQKPRMLLQSVSRFSGFVAMSGSKMAHETTEETSASLGCINLVIHRLRLLKVASVKN